MLGLGERTSCRDLDLLRHSSASLGPAAGASGEPALDRPLLPSTTLSLTLSPASRLLRSSLMRIGRGGGAAASSNELRGWCCCAGEPLFTLSPASMLLSPSSPTSPSSSLTACSPCARRSASCASSPSESTAAPEPGIWSKPQLLLPSSIPWEWESPAAAVEERRLTTSLLLLGVREPLINRALGFPGDAAAAGELLDAAAGKEAAGMRGEAAPAAPRVPTTPAVLQAPDGLA